MNDFWIGVLAMWPVISFALVMLSVLLVLDVRNRRQR
jgi:hypothetical protein